MEGSRFSELLRPVQTHWILLLNVSSFYLICLHPRPKSQVVVMVILDEFKSQLYMTIHYTYNDTLEGLGCYELSGAVQCHSTSVSNASHTILVWWVGSSTENHPQLQPKSQLVVPIMDNEFQSQPYMTIHYAYHETRFAAVNRVIWIPSHTILVMWCDELGHLLKSPPPTTKMSACGAHGWWTMNSNLNPVWPFIMLIMRHWNSPAAVMWLIRIPTQTILVMWCDELVYLYWQSSPYLD